MNRVMLMSGKAKFLKIFYSFIKSGALVLDLGAGEGTYAVALEALGANVVAIDKKARPANLSPHIEWKSVDIRDWIQKDDTKKEYDAILSSDILQFFERDWVTKKLFEFIKTSLQSNGILAIRTFYKPPEPPFDKPHLSYWNVADILDEFSNWDTLYSNQEEKDAKDLNGVERHFFITDVIARKTANTSQKVSK